ncbi:MAG: hypothetical protein ACRD2N_04180 [Vicinamibacterales bacterium]
MLRAAATVILAALVTVPLGAQRSRGGPDIPPGQLPPPGTCRVWYEGLPPGRQPGPMSCREAERIASRRRDARVIYGSDTGRNDDGWWDRSRSPYPSPDRGRSGGYGGYGYNTPAYHNGYEDGLDRGRDDGRDRDRYDPTRHSRYRSADHGYERRYGTREWYRNVYRDGFRAGYEEGYRDGRRNDRGWWPF